MEQLSSLDAAFVDAEDQDRNASFAIASIAVFEGPAPSYEEFLAAIAQRLPLVPPYRRKLRKVPLGLARPFGLMSRPLPPISGILTPPPPGGDPQLRRLMARVATQRLDATTPCGSTGWSRGSIRVAGR
jgi:diacylglycerol O-acyltransferase